MKFILSLFLLISVSVFATEVPRANIELNESNVVTLNEAFTLDSVSKIQHEILQKSTVINPPSEIYLFLSTPGGSVTAGKLLIDMLNALPVKVSTITSFAASMGYCTVQGLERGTRYILPSGTLMSHRAAVSGIGGQIPGEADTRLQMIKDSVNALERVAARRVGIPVDDYKKLIMNEFWIHGEDAVKANHADKVAMVTCGKDLTGTKVETVYFMGIPLSVTFSKCPLIQAPLDIKVENQMYLTNEERHNILTSYQNTFNFRNNIIVTP